MSTPTSLTDYRLDQFQAQLAEATRPLYAARAAAINAARARGTTWREIAAQLDMAEVSVQRAPGVDSPWNATRGRTPANATNGDTA